jgi:hypothetical protein
MVGGTLGNGRTVTENGASDARELPSLVEIRISEYLPTLFCGSGVP